ncbi:TetR/AcrR family transcriptional regulator [Pedobacter westerhofensis]|nr:TetR/AcrR family transcriptional regulator [Pedobacter westerhofensis]
MTFPEEVLINDKKATLLKVSEELFATYGFDGTSTRMIAEQSGINIAMINYYFGSKELLYTAIFENRLIYIIEEIDRIGQLDIGPAEKLELYLRGYIRRIQNNQGFYRMESRQLTMVEQPPIVTLLETSRNKAFLLIHNIITRGILQNVFQHIDIEVFALNIIYLLPTVFTRPPALFAQLGFSTNDHRQSNSLENRIIQFLMASLIIKKIPQL